jgi:carbon-monoxide dehydrogenase small subunit/xanthine dehydrogenase small subunit
VAELIDVGFTLNRRPQRLRVRSDLRLLDVLRDELLLTGAKEGCGRGECGSCTVILDGRSVSACLVMAYQADGATIETIEGLAAGEKLHPLQEAFVERGAIHCGACSPGMILAAKALLDQNPTPGLPEIREALSGNLCRCTGYGRIVAAVARGAGAAHRPRPAVPSSGIAPSYFRPRSLEEALEILAQRAGEARPVAGGTSILVGVDEGRIDAGVLFDVTAVPEMQGIEERGDSLWLGALVTHSEAAAAPLVHRVAPALRAACASCLPPQIRNRATLGGSLASAAGSSDAVVALVAADAVLEIVSVSARREVTAADLSTGPGETLLAPDELIVGIRIPRREGARGAFVRLGQRRGHSVAKISVAVAMTFKEARPDWVRVVLGGAAPTVLRAVETEKALAAGGYDALQKAKEAVRAEVRPVDDHRSSREYRREMAVVLLERAVRDLTDG